MELDKDFNLIIGLRIREVREVLHMTREQFSEKCDISTSFLSAVENGKKQSLQNHYTKYVLQQIFLLII